MKTKQATYRLEISLIDRMKEAVIKQKPRFAGPSHFVRVAITELLDRVDKEEDFQSRMMVDDGKK